VYKNYAFIVTEGVADQGLQIFDLTQLREVKNPPVVFQETAHYAHFGSAHTLTMNEETGFAFAAGSISGGKTCGGGLHMIDVRVPTKPAFAGCYAKSGYIHDAQCVVYRGPDQHYKGRELCLNSAVDKLDIIDVTDKLQPKVIGRGTYPNAVYTHQGWFTEDQRYFFVDDEENPRDKTRTIVFDLSDLDDPVVLTTFYGTTTATAHNLYIRGRYMYQSNYTAGLRIIDVGDPKTPKEVGYLDTDPTQDGPGQRLGSWGNYPFLKNDVVAVASNGLFLVRLRSR
jgi:choice-of-anchor B domain-containing protein